MSQEQPLEWLSARALLRYAEKTLGLSGPKLAALLGVAYNGGYCPWMRDERRVPLYVRVSVLTLLRLHATAPEVYARHVETADWLQEAVEDKKVGA